jgi:hypothetical protein
VTKTEKLFLALVAFCLFALLLLEVGGRYWR